MVLQQAESSSENILHWAMIGNDTIIYDLTILGRFGTEDAYQYWYPLNNTQLRIKIDNLPELNSSMSPESYILSIASSDKVYASRLDGSEVKFSLREVIERVMSLFIIPIGDWEFFDQNFNEAFKLKVSSGDYPRYYEYIGESQSDTVYRFSRRWLQQESGTGTFQSETYGEIEKASGIPIYISHHWLFYHVNGFEYTIILERHNTISSDH